MVLKFQLLIGSHFHLANHATYIAKNLHRGSSSHRVALKQFGDMWGNRRDIKQMG